MNHARYLTAALFLLLSTPAAAQLDPLTGADAVHDAVAADRSAYGRVIHLFGDSISRGFALDVYGETILETEPLYPYASIRATVNWVFQTNDRLPHDVAVFGGTLGDRDGSAWPGIRERIRDGVIRSGDIVFVQDAGDHQIIGTPDDYEAWWAEVRRIFTERHDITLVMTSTADYCHTANLGCMAEHQFDRVFGSRTYNEAMHAAATADRGYVGQTLWLDMNALMDAKRDEVLAEYGVDIILPDGIPPNVWGQPYMTGLYLKVSGAALNIESVDVIAAHAGAKAALLPGALSSEQAADLMRELLMP